VRRPIDPNLKNEAIIKTNRFSEDGKQSEIKNHNKTIEASIKS
jgi:hypothetical protein